MTATDTHARLNLHVRGVDLRLEFPQKTLAFRFQRCIVSEIFRCLLVHSRHGRYSIGRDSLRCFTHWAYRLVGSVIGPALRAWQTIPRALWVELLHGRILRAAFGAGCLAVTRERCRSNRPCVVGMCWSRCIHRLTRNVPVPFESTKLNAIIGAFLSALPRRPLPREQYMGPSLPGRNTTGRNGTRRTSPVKPRAGPANRCDSWLW